MTKLPERIVMGFDCVCSLVQLLLDMFIRCTIEESQCDYISCPHYKALRSINFAIIWRIWHYTKVKFASLPQKRIRTDHDDAILKPSKLACGNCKLFVSSSNFLHIIHALKSSLNKMVKEAFPSYCGNLLKDMIHEEDWIWWHWTTYSP